MGDKAKITSFLDGLAAATPELGNVERAVRPFGGADVIREVTNTPLPPAHRTNYFQAVAAARATLRIRLRHALGGGVRHELGAGIGLCV